MTSRNIF